MQHGRRFKVGHSLAIAALFFWMESLPAFAAPPFTTDNSEPTSYRGYDIYIASDYARSSDGVEVTVPHFEINYGILPNVSIAVTLPIAGSRGPFGATNLGYGDTALVVKARVVQETDHIPQIALEPTIVLPSGNVNKNLGGGFTKTFLPVWAEKGFGKYTVYGGAGLWSNPGPGNKNYTFIGLVVTREMGHGWTIGTELFGQSADVVGGSGSVGFNFGATRQYDEHHEILFSLGRSLHGKNTFSAYAAFGFSLGPRDKDDADEPAAAVAPAASKVPATDDKAASNPGLSFVRQPVRTSVSQRTP